MKIVYTPMHKQHNPTRELRSSAGTMVSHPEAPERAHAILLELSGRAGCEVLAPVPCAVEDLFGVHEPGFVRYLRVCE